MANPTAPQPCSSQACMEQDQRAGAHGAENRMRSWGAQSWDPTTLPSKCERGATAASQMTLTPWQTPQAPPQDQLLFAVKDLGPRPDKLMKSC